MKVGVISDTHGLLRPEAVAALQGCERIIHAGDIGNADVLAQLRAIAPLDVVPPEPPPSEPPSAPPLPDAALPEASEPHAASRGTPTPTPTNPPITALREASGVLFGVSWAI